MDEIEKLQEQLNNPNIREIEKKKRIGVHNSAISRIFNTVGTLTDVSF